MGYIEKQLDPLQAGNAAQHLEFNLRQRIVGQDEAIRQVVRVYQSYLSGMSSPGRPVANLLFLGPTGSGKTRLVEAVAESLLGEPRSIIKIDCGEYQHSHEIAKLIGSPPGYLGHRETQALLSQELLDQYHTEKIHLSFVLFDEIEKASDTLWNLLLGILDKATLTLGTNRRVDFTKAMIFMTSNLGARQMNSMLRPGLGFSVSSQENDVIDYKTNDRMHRAALEAARRKFSPEFMNRIDQTVVFQPLGRPELHGILKIELNEIQQRVLNANVDPFVLTVTDQARGYLVQEGTEMAYGARHLKRAIDRLLVHPLSNLMASGQVCGGDVVRVDFDVAAGQLSFFKEASQMRLPSPASFFPSGRRIDGSGPTGGDAAMAQDGVDETIVGSPVRRRLTARNQSTSGVPSGRPRSHQSRYASSAMLPSPGSSRSAIPGGTTEET